MCACARARVHVCLYVCARMCVNVCAFVRASVCACARTCFYIVQHLHIRCTAACDWLQAEPRLLRLHSFDRACTELNSEHTFVTRSAPPYG